MKYPESTRFRPHAVNLFSHSLYWDRLWITSVLLSIWLTRSHCCLATVIKLEWGREVPWDSGVTGAPWCPGRLTVVLILLIFCIYDCPFYTANTWSSWPLADGVFNLQCVIAGETTVTCTWQMKTEHYQFMSYHLWCSHSDTWVLHPSQTHVTNNWSKVWCHILCTDSSFSPSVPLFVVKILSWSRETLSFLSSCVQ